ncbi:MAG: DUF3696 domain-containing protein [Dysgonamonadaceae bacterium]|jgi:predicted ATPase|nr:DUF3696 domain-containing protein [Dysgonamonadaceae bacterium]
MYLEQLKLENFKCFQKEQTFDFGKITLLTGANSSGKSSVIYAVLGALQSGEFPSLFSTNGKYVNMGSFEEVSFDHKKDSIIKIHLKFENIRSGENKYFDIQTFWSFGKNTLPELKNLRIESSTSSFEINDPEDLKNLKLFPPDIQKTIVSLKVFLSKYEEKINFIGSFRYNPERTYNEKNYGRYKVDKSGDGYLDQIIAWETQSSPKFEMLISIMKDLSLLEDIESKRLEGGRYEFKIKTIKGGAYSSLSDVGYGISQFMPVMVADLQLPNDSQLFVSQPEIHLHPNIQSLFGDYLVRQVNNSGKRYILETHSEYLLNKIRLAIVKGEISEEDVRVYFLENNNTDTDVFPIKFTKNGQILNAPKGFFETYLIDSMEIVLNAAP